MLGALSKNEPALRHPKAYENARHAFYLQIARYEAQRRTIVYIDESKLAHNMPRAHGYSLQGSRCYGVHNWQARGRTNAIGALISKFLATISLFETNVNANVFHVWVTQDLLPKLPPRCIMVMDNAAFHKRSNSQQAIHNAGHTSLHLPPYSPNLNSIEHKWAQAKAHRRKVQCSIDSLFKQHAF